MGTPRAMAKRSLRVRLGGDSSSTRLGLALTLLAERDRIEDSRLTPYIRFLQTFTAQSFATPIFFNATARAALRGADVLHWTRAVELLRLGFRARVFPPFPSSFSLPPKLSTSPWQHAGEGAVLHWLQKYCARSPGSGLSKSAGVCEAALQVSGQ